MLFQLYYLKMSHSLPPAPMIRYDRTLQPFPSSFPISISRAHVRLKLVSILQRQFARKLAQLLERLVNGQLTHQLIWHGIKHTIAIGGRLVDLQILHTEHIKKQSGRWLGPWPARYLHSLLFSNLSLNIQPFSREHLFTS